MLPKKSQAIQQHIRALRVLAQDNEEKAALLVQAALYLWQFHSFPSLAGRCPNHLRPLLSNSRIKAFAFCLSDQDMLTSAFWLSSAYAQCAGQSLRKERALFFTPPELSARLIDDLIANGASLTRHVWVDPASGGAAFLAPVAARMAAALKSEGRNALEIVEHLSKHLIGNDIDPVLAHMSMEFLRMVLCEEISAAKREPEFNVTTNNALTDLIKLEGTADVVICNPPYRKMSAGEVAHYRDGYKETMAGQPNLYALFFKQSLNLLKPEGIAGLLTPTSFLSGQYFSPVRSHLRNHAEIYQIDLIERLGAFIGVEQETAITIFKKNSHKKLLTKDTSVYAFTKDSGFVGIGKCTIPKSKSSWAIPRAIGDDLVLKELNGTAFRLRDYGYIARAGLFVWNRDTRRTYQRTPRKKSESVYPLIWSSDIRQDGSIQLGSPRPPGQSGKFVDLGAPNSAGVIRKPAVVLQRVTSTVQPRRLVGAAVPTELLKEYGGVVGENHVVFLEQTSDTPAFPPTQLAQILRSEIIDRLFRSISGAVNVSIFELDHLVLPDPALLKEEWSRSSSVDEAVRKAFHINH